jgi:hypothetical protein
MLVSSPTPEGINYFEPAATIEEAILRSIKGNYRRLFVSHAMQREGLESVPEAWKEHNISESLKGLLGQQNPSFRGGEDLPDLEDTEIEIARLTLADSVHGEVTSLRAKQVNREGRISLRLVDEYESEITLPCHGRGQRFEPSIAHHPLPLCANHLLIFVGELGSRL